MLLGFIWKCHSKSPVLWKAFVRSWWDSWWRHVEESYIFRNKSLQENLVFPPPALYTSSNLAPISLCSTMCSTTGLKTTRQTNCRLKILKLARNRDFILYGYVECAVRNKCVVKHVKNTRPFQVATAFCILICRAWRFLLFQNSCQHLELSQFSASPFR